MVTKMKTLRIAILLMFVAMMGCQQRPPASQDKTSLMTLDTTASEKSMTKVPRTDTVRPAESIADFKALPNIMQLDIDARQKTPSREVTYVKLGEPLRPSEKRK
jgi:hypothetical protein